MSVFLVWVNLQLKKAAKKVMNEQKRRKQNVLQMNNTWNFGMFRLSSGPLHLHAWACICAVVLLHVAVHIQKLLRGFLMITHYSWDLKCEMRQTGEADDKSDETGGKEQLVCVLGFVCTFVLKTLLIYHVRRMFIVWWEWEHNDEHSRRTEI